MKKILTLACAALFACTAATTATAADVSFSGKKFYVNPGHGGHDSDDRPTALPLGVAMFYESDGTLDRGKHLRDFLQAYKASVKMSRTTNTTADDLALSTIASQSNSYGGYFMSLHSNGANASANYVVAFYRGTTSGAQAISGAKDMATTVSKWHDNNHLTNLTYSTPRGLADYSFYGYNLGVLRTNNRPGYLVETWFHDYRPDGLRMKSTIYNKYHAWQILRATVEKPGPTSSGTITSCIVGDIRDLTKSCGYTNYTTRGRDSYLAINSATVNLYNSSGTKIGTMTTDKCCNGIYGFFGLSAGTYQVEVVKSGYATQKKSVTVAASASAKLLFNLVEGVSAGITTSKESLDFGSVTVGNSKSLTFTVTASGLSANITATSGNSAVTVSPTSISKTASGVTVTVKYTPTAAGNLSTTIKLTSGSVSAVVAVSGKAVNPPLTFTEGWNYSETSGKTPAWLPEGGWVKLRNMCVGDGKLYIVNPSDGIIYVVKAQTCELLTKLDMTGVTGGTFKVMDVKYVDGKVVACNLVGDATQSIKVYVWDTDYSAPRCILETTERSSVTRMGDTFDFDGTLTSGRLLFCGGGISDQNKVIGYKVTNGVAETTPSVAIATAISDEKTLVMGLSPRVVAETNNRYWVMGQSYQPTLIQADGLASASINLDALDKAIQGNAFTPFVYKGESFALATTYTYSTTQTEMLKDGKVVLLDGTDGWASATQIAKYPSAGLGSTRNTNFSTSCPVAVNGDKGVEFWVLISNQGIAYYKSGTVPTYTYTTPYPTVTATPSSVAFSEIFAGETSKRSITVTTSSLEADVDVSLTGTDSDMFTISTDKIAKTAGSVNIDVTYAPSAEGNHSAAITFTSTNMETVTVALTGTAKKAITDYSLTQDWAKTTGHITPSSAGYGWSTGFDGKIYFNDNANQMLKYWDSTGLHDAIASVNGTAITSDAAGNIILSASLWASSATTFKVLPKGGSAWQDLAVTLPDGVSAAATKYIGKAIGNIVSGGAVMMIIPSGNTKVAKVYFSKGAQASCKAIDLGGIFTADAETFAMPLEASVSSDKIAVRNRNNSHFYLNNNTSGTFEALANNGISNTQGGTLFTLNEKLYAVEPIGTTYGDGFQIVNVTENKVVATHDFTVKGTLSPTPNCITAEVIDKNTVRLYQYVPGVLAAQYTFVAPSSSTGIEDVNADVAPEVSAEVEYYNLQGIRVNPDNLKTGIYIRRQGKEVKKILVK